MSLGSGRYLASLNRYQVDQFKLSQRGDLIWCSLFHSYSFYSTNVRLCLFSNPSCVLRFSWPLLLVFVLSLCTLLLGLLYSEWVFLALSSSSPSQCVCPSVEDGEISPSANICWIGSWGDSSSFQDLAQSFYALPLTFFLSHSARDKGLIWDRRSPLRSGLLQLCPFSLTSQNSLLFSSFHLFLPLLPWVFLSLAYGLMTSVAGSYF